MLGPRAGLASGVAPLKSCLRTTALCCAHHAPSSPQQVICLHYTLPIFFIYLVAYARASFVSLDLVRHEEIVYVSRPLLPFSPSPPLLPVDT